MTTLSSPARQPFGAIEGARLRNLGNVKNKQNAFVQATTSQKRRHEPSADALDLENVDPFLLSPSKKAKNNDGQFSKPHFNLNTVSPSVPTLSTRQIITPKRLARKAADIKPVSFSAPAAPAGRSPKRNRVGILSRRRISGGYSRVDPPAFGLSKPSASGLPFSIDAALSGTVSSYTPRPTPTPTDDSLPRGWQFEIHEDTPDEELGNLMQHSTQTLDISDDESKARERDARGKENIPPEFAGYAALPAVSRRDAMLDDARTPLGDLAATAFYADGCDANSYIIVEEQEKAVAAFAYNALVKEASTTPTPSPTDAATANQDVWRHLLAQVQLKNVGPETALTAGDTPIEIWESESAKGDAEPETQEVVSTSEPLEECMIKAEVREEQALAVAVAEA